MLGCAEGRSRLLQNGARVVEQAAADEDLSDICRRERCPRQVSETLELVPRVCVVGRRVPPPPLGVRLNTEVGLDHGCRARGSDLSVDLERFDFVDRLLRLAEVEEPTVERGVRLRERATRAKRLGRSPPRSRSQWPHAGDLAADGFAPAAQEAV